MTLSSSTRYSIGLLGFLVVGSALAKDPAQTPGPAASAPTSAACIDSPRGRTHVLRMCGDKAHWIKLEVPAAKSPPRYPSAYEALVPPGAMNTAALSTGFQRY